MRSQSLFVLRLFLLVPALSLFTAEVQAQTSAEASPTGAAAEIEEPPISLPELKSGSPFRTISRSKRKASDDALVLLCREAVDTTSRRLLSTDQHTPWQMMHALLGLRQDFQLQHNGDVISGMHWIQEGQSFENEYWFEKTKFGGRAHPYSRPYAFEGHANQFLAILSMCSTDLDQKFGTADGTITMRDMVKHAQMAISETDEPTWTLWGLSRYLPPSAQWRNAKGELWSIERLVQSQCNKPIVRGAPCGGTHALFALSHARNVYQQQGKPLRGVWLQAEYKIRQFINTAKMQQNSNGTLSSDFFRGRKYDPDFNKRMASAGHILEFLMLAVPQRELNSRWIRMAIEATARDLLNNRNAYVKCSPLYHSVNALNIYLDRVNPRLSPEELATQDQETQTVEVPRTSPGMISLKPVPATSITQSRELPPADEKPSEETVDVAVRKPSTPPPPVPGAQPSTGMEPVEVLETVESVQIVETKPQATEVRKAEEAAVPALEYVPVAPEAIARDRDKWLATPQERRTAMVVTESQEAELEPPQAQATTASESDSVAGEKQVTDETKSTAESLILAPTAEAMSEETQSTENNRPEVDNTETDGLETEGLKMDDAKAATQDESPVLQKSADDLIAPNADIDEPLELEMEATGRVEPPQDDRPADTGLSVKSVSVARVVDSTQVESETLVDDPGNQTVTPNGINDSFLDTSMKPEDWVQEFEQESREIFAARNAIASAVNLSEGMSIADVGCGTGLFLKAFSKAVGPEGRVFAIDISPRFVDYVERRVQAEDLQNIDVVRNQSTSLMLMNHKVDRVFVCDTYHYFDHHKQMLASIFAALKPGGELIVVDFERIPGKSREWVLQHVRADKQTFQSEISVAGFEFVEEVEIPELSENYVLRFRKPAVK